MKYALVFTICLVLVSCVGTTHQVSPCLPMKDLYGFWGGLWHGMIAPFTFIFSLFNKDIAVFAVNNTGRWYTFGFILGIGGLTGGASKSTTKK